MRKLAVQTITESIIDHNYNYLLHKVPIMSKEANKLNYYYLIIINKTLDFAVFSKINLKL